jgi:hypothetical protein
VGEGLYGSMFCSLSTTRGRRAVWMHVLFTKHYVMRTRGRRAVWIHVLFTKYYTWAKGCMDPCFVHQALRHEDTWMKGCMDPWSVPLGTGWRQVVSFTHCCFIHRERTPGTCCIRGWVCPRNNLDDNDSILNPTRTNTLTHHLSNH